MQSYWGTIQKRVGPAWLSLDGLLETLVCLTSLKLERAPAFAEEAIYNPAPEHEEGEL